mgnify:CR=1 FL=1
MPYTINDMRQQLASSELELERAKANVYGIDAIIRLLTHQISEAEKPENPALAETPVSE